MSGATIGHAARRLGFTQRGPVRIEARGREFQWRFCYPGSDGRLGSEDDIQVAGDLHLPAGATVEINLQSDDFIYVWSSPALGLEEIAVPELVHRLTFRALPVGRFDILADPMCGWRFLHDDVLGHVVIDTASDFNSWSAQQLTDATPEAVETNDE